MEEKVKDTNKSKANIDKKVKKFMKSVREFLKNKSGGAVPPEYECSLLILETYFEQFLILNAEIKELPSIIEDSRYGKTTTPLLAARDKASMRLEAAMKELGLTLKAQAKLDIVEPSKVELNPLESFMNKKIEKR